MDAGGVVSKYIDTIHLHTKQGILAFMSRRLLEAWQMGGRQRQYLSMIWSRLHGFYTGPLWKFNQQSWRRTDWQANGGAICVLLQCDPVYNTRRRLGLTCG
jgi:hypothetical protein